MLWNKTSVHSEHDGAPLTGSVACVCPYVPEVSICVFSVQTAQRVAQKEAYSRLGHTLTLSSQLRLGAALL